MVMLPEFQFPRSAKPHGTTGRPGLVLFSDGGKPASAGVAYLRWELQEMGPNGEAFESRILAAKARIGRHTIPRQELNALVIICRLTTALWNGMVEKPAYVSVLVDSTCTISSLECDQRILAPFFSSRCAEVLEHFALWSEDTEVLPIQYVPTDLNISDIATKGKAVAADIQLGSVWQTSIPWILGPIPATSPPMYQRRNAF